VSYMANLASNQLSDLDVEAVANAAAESLLEAGLLQFCGDEESHGADRFNSPDGLCSSCGRPSAAGAKSEAYSILQATLGKALRSTGL
jgi:hypothetical protein